MEEKADLKFKYDKLRKKYVVLKQQTALLKETINKKEEKYELLDESYKQLEIKYRDCSANLDASQYKETMLMRQIEEILCQFDQHKQNLLKQNQNNVTYKTGTGIFTGLLPVNGVIMNFQKNDNLEDKISVLQEELDLKILENEQLHMKEFDLKKEHQMIIEEQIATNKQLNNELQTVRSELQQFKCKASNEKNIIEQLEQKDKQNNQTILGLQTQLTELNEITQNKYENFRKLIPEISIEELRQKHISWLYSCKQSYYSNFLKFILLSSEFLKKVSFVIDSWKLFIVNSSNVCSDNYFIEMIYKKILFFLDRASEKIVNPSRMLNNNILFRPSILEEIHQSNEGDSSSISESIFYYEIINIESREGLNFIYKALKLQIVALKVLINQNSRDVNFMNFKKQYSEKIRNFSIKICRLKNLIIRINNLISFNLLIGKDPDILNVHKSKTNSFRSAFIRFSMYIREYFNQKTINIEEKSHLYNYICKLMMQNTFFENFELTSSEKINEVLLEIFELENKRKTLYVQICERIKNCAFEISSNLNILEEFLTSNNPQLNYSLLTFSKNKFSNAFHNSIQDLIQYIDKNFNSDNEIMPYLYQHPSTICQSIMNINEHEIIMRETQSKLINASPKIKLPELHILNKRIEELEETKKKNLDTINNLREQLILNNEVSNAENTQLVSTNTINSDSNLNDSKYEQNTILDQKRVKITTKSQNYNQNVCELLLREANETLEHTVATLQLRIDDLNDDIKVIKQSYDEQITLLTQHICNLSEKLSQTDASMASSCNQEILCHSCNSWCTLDIVMKTTKGACQKCKTKLMRQK